MGNDLTPANAARVSYGKRKEVFDDKDADLLKYLAEHEHTSPFRHAFVSMHFKTPLFVARQLAKHQVGLSWNEISGRYVEMKEEFFVPKEFRMQAKVNKQGSEGAITDQDVAMTHYLDSCKTAMDRYHWMLELGVCREQARAVLPLALYTEWHWSGSLQAWAHMVRLRTDAHAQWETQEFARAAEGVLNSIFPISMNVLKLHGGS